MSLLTNLAGGFHATARNAVTLQATRHKKGLQTNLNILYFFPILSMLRLDLDSLRAAFDPSTAEPGAEWSIRCEEDRLRVVVSVRTEDCASHLSLQRSGLSIVRC